MLATHNKLMNTPNSPILVKERNFAIKLGKTSRLKLFIALPSIARSIKN